MERKSLEHPDLRAKLVIELNQSLGDARLQIHQLEQTLATKLHSETLSDNLVSNSLKSNTHTERELQAQRVENMLMSAIMNIHK